MALALPGLPVGRRPAGVGVALAHARPRLAERVGLVTTVVAPPGAVLLVELTVGSPRVGTSRSIWPRTTASPKARANGTSGRDSASASSASSGESSQPSIIARARSGSRSSSSPSPASRSVSASRRGGAIVAGRSTRAPHGRRCRSRAPCERPSTAAPESRRLPAIRVDAGGGVAASGARPGRACARRRTGTRSARTRRAPNRRGARPAGGAGRAERRVGGLVPVGSLDRSAASRAPAMRPRRAATRTASRAGRSRSRPVAGRAGGSTSAAGPIDPSRARRAPAAAGS